MPGKVKDAGSGHGKKAAQQPDAPAEAAQAAVRDRAVPAAGRAGEDAGVDAHRGRQDRGHLRGPRRGRQGRHDQAGGAVPQPPRGPDRRAARADRAGAHAVVLPALHRSPARSGRAGPVRPELVQPGGRGARHGVLHQGGVQPVPAPVPDLRAAARRGRHPAAQVLVLGQRRRAAAPVPSAGWTTRCAGGSSRPWTWSPSPGGRTTPGPRTRCSCTPTSPRRRGTWWRATTSGAPAST